jgi:ferrous iron transport protein B
MIADQRYGYIKSILKRGVIHHKYDQNRLYSSDRIDKVITNRFLGPLIMLAVRMAGKFFWLAGVNPVGRFTGGVAEIADRIRNH